MARWSSPTLNLALVAVVTFLLLEVGLLAGGNPWALALTWPLGDRALTLVTSVVTHATWTHLLTNMVGFLVLGLLLERRTSNVRFYAFVLVAGMVSGVAEVGVSVLVFGRPAAVLGTSGAIFALLGYLLSSNRLTDRAVAGVSLSPRHQFAAFLVFAGVLTLATDGERVAVVAHASGLLFGLLAGRAHVLRTGREDRSAGDPEPW